MKATSTARRSPSPATKQARSESIKTAKSSLRVEMIAKLKANPKERTQLQSAETTTTLFKLPQWKRARSVLTFASLPQEYQTVSLITEAFAQDKHVYLPRVTDIKASTMEMLEILSMDDYKLNEISSYGISEPTLALPPATQARISAQHQSYLTTHPYLFTEAHDIATERPNLLTQPPCIAKLDLILCPFVLVDAQCNRVGYGGGYYDRYIQRVQAKRQELGLPDVPIIGVGISDQFVDSSLPSDHFDIQLDGVIVGDRAFGLAQTDLEKSAVASTE